MNRAKPLTIAALYACATALFISGCESSQDSQSLIDSVGGGTKIESEEVTETVGVAVDEIPLANIVWLHTDVSKWAITSELKVSLSGSLIIYDQDGTSKWPPASAIGGSMAGNAWVFVPQDGFWYAATHEWMTPGQTHKLKSSVSGAYLKQESYIPSSWTPTPGVQYGFMVSGLARSDARNVEERTQIKLMTWE